MARLIEAVGTDQLVTFNCASSDIKGSFSIPFVNIDMTGLASEYLVNTYGLKEAIVVTPDAGKNGIR